jgi:hypothetical protein
MKAVAGRSLTANIWQILDFTAKFLSTRNCVCEVCLIKFVEYNV